MQLNWLTICPSNSREHLVRGTELEMAFVPGTASRLAIYTVRTYDRDGYDVRYRVRDAGRISDADVRAGKRPPIIGEFATMDELEIAIENTRKAHPEAFQFPD
jgi:hypothetical protein